MKAMRDLDGGPLFCSKKKDTTGILLPIKQIKAWIKERKSQDKNAEAKQKVGKPGRPKKK